MEYGLIGHPLGHSYSKIIHNKIGNYDYSINDITPEKLPLFFEKKDFKGINVTIPYKQEVIKYLDEISEEAKEIGAVNTILNKNGRLIGYNTDCHGLEALIKNAKISIKDKKVLILGTGGTSKTAHYVAKKMGAKTILKVSRKPSEDTISYQQAEKEHTDAQIIINTTPCGMFPSVHEKPIDISFFKNLIGIIDAIYNPLYSELVMDGKNKNITSTGGLFMLVAQAVFASSIFFESKPDNNLINKIYEDVFFEKNNIVLIGMPSCGKSTIGKKIAEQTGKQFIDCDQKIIEKINMSISDFFKKNGEEAFRKIESETIKEIALLNNSVISTGGGCILNKDNIDNLKQNGTIVFINRDLNLLLATNDRPLSSSPEAIEKLYKTRLPLYKAYCEHEINGNSSINEVTALILAAINYKTSFNSK